MAAQRTPDACPHGVVEVPFSSFCGECQRHRTSEAKAFMVGDFVRHRTSGLAEITAIDDTEECPIALRYKSRELDGATGGSKREDLTFVSRPEQRTEPAQVQTLEASPSTTENYSVSRASDDARGSQGPLPSSRAEALKSPGAISLWNEAIEAAVQVCNAKRITYDRRAMAIRDDSDRADAEAAEQEADEQEHFAVAAQACAAEIRKLAVLSEPVASRPAVPPGEKAPTPQLRGGVPYKKCEPCNGLGYVENRTESGGGAK